MTPRPRVVYDCNVFLQALLTPDGPSGRCVRLVDEHRVLLLLSGPVIDEVRAVLTRPAIRQLARTFPEAAVDPLISRLSYVAEVLAEVKSGLDLPRDPDDAKYVDLAVAGEAAFIVTRDADLLDLAVGHSAAAKQFRQLTQNRTQILDPVSFLREFESPSS